MHGRPRKPPTPEEEKAYDLKAVKLRSLQSQFLQFHHNQIYTKEALEVCAKLLQSNPEYITAWNYRKFAVEHILNQSENKTEIDLDSIKSICSEELKVTERALAKNYKSYGAWYHRKWVLRKGHSSVDRELQLLQVFLKQDTRNFHAWNYRRFVAALKNRSDKEELQFTTDMINDNFSNYSAWHNRSVLLSHLLKNKVQGYFPKEKFLTEENNLVHQALFIDPDDQSGWFYHHWLIDQIVKEDTPLLVTTWPPHGSDLNISMDGCLDDNLLLSPSTSFNLNTGKVPIILYFSKAVEGVNSSTITMESSVCDTNEDLIWTPLSTNNSGSAQAWVAHLNFLEEFYFSQANLIKVIVGHSEGIMSMSGFHYNHPTYFEFTVYVSPYASKFDDLKGLEMISWEDEIFHNCDSHLKPSSQISCSDPLKNKDDSVSVACEWNLETIANEIALFRELLAETECKIGKLTLARLLTAHGAMILHNKPSDYSRLGHCEEVLELYSDLMNLDPPHSQFYKDEYSLILLQQLTSSPESLLRHCYRYRHSSSSSMNGYVGLRLCNLSLSRIGSFKQLLWIQMLDLSQNQLRSIEGLEAMQLLSCLNLSNNKIGSFSALEPLKLLKSLKALNISYNEIGAHSVNTRRYLCSSPLSHSLGSDWNFSEFETDSIDFTNYWEAFSIFKDLKLTQLEIIGNVGAEEKFKLFLVKVMPALKWLDGVELY